MKAILLAAGASRRMRPLTDDRPKTMLRVGDRTIVEHIVGALLHRGIRQICVVTGYRSEQLRDFMLETFPEAELTFVHNETYDTNNNIYSLHLALESYPIDDDVLLVESDLVFEQAVLDRILDCSYPNAALVDRFRHGMDGTVVALADGGVQQVIPPHIQGDGFDFSDKYKTLNVYKLSQDFAGRALRRLLSFYATTYDDSCYYELILGVLLYMGAETLHACVLDGERWIEVDAPNDVRLAEMAFDDDRRLRLLDYAFGGQWNSEATDFAFIRNMYFPPPALLADMSAFLPRLLHNYGSRQGILDEKLGYFLRTSPTRACLLNGSSQAYPILRQMLADRRALLPDPTFGEYQQVFPTAATYPDRGWVTPEHDIPAADLEDAEVVVVVSPNNPTGSAFAAADVLALARRHPAKLFVVDESFADFADGPAVQDLLESEDVRNVLVIKSLSKCLGIPGLRLGYVYSRDETLVAQIRAQLPIWNANSMAEYFLEIVLKYRCALADSFRRTVADRREFAARLAGVPEIEHVSESHADFLMVRLRLDASAVTGLRERLLRRFNLYVKDVAPKVGDGAAYLRLAVRLPEENARLVDALAAELAAVAVPPAPSAHHDPKTGPRVGVEG